MARSAFWWTASGAWACVIFYLSSLPESSLPRYEIPHLDKVVHMLEYAVLSLLLGLALRGSPRPSLRRRAALCAVGICAAYALTDELHQLFVPDRCPSLADWLFDTGGAAGVQIVWRGIR